jgi:restriction system protein
MIGLSKWIAKGLAWQIERQNEQARDQLLELLLSMPPTKFEELIGVLLVKLGFEDVTVTSPSCDGGIDVRGTMVTGDVIRTRMAVQVKRWKLKLNVQAPTIQQVRGSLGAHEQGMIITTSDFSKGAREEAERSGATPVGLMNGQQLVKLLVENEIGARLTPYNLIQLVEDEDDEDRS